MVPLSMTLIDP